MQQEDIFVKYGGQDAQMLSIDLMEGHDFEYWCAGLLRKIGFSRVEVTPGSNDQGVDILAQKDGVKYAIQCKRYSHDLGNTPVQEVHAGKAMYNCHVGVVLTNQHFTKGANELAKATGVLLWDREWIKRNLQTTQETEKCEVPVLGDTELFSAAVDAVLETNNSSVSMIQRHFNIGYARAARLIDEMEEKGIVGSFQGSKPRAILITKDDWNKRHGNHIAMHNVIAEEEPKNIEPITQSTYKGQQPREYDFDMPGDDTFEIKVKNILESISKQKSTDREKNPFWDTVLGIFKRIILPPVAWLDTAFFFAAIGDLIIGNPRETWHYIYIIFTMLLLPSILAIWLMVNKKGNSNILNRWYFWFLFSIIVLILGAFSQ